MNRGSGDVTQWRYLECPGDSADLGSNPRLMESAMLHVIEIRPYGRAEHVKNGDFDRMLLRPRTTIVQLFGYELTLRRIGRLAQGAAVLVFAIATLDVVWSGPRIVLLGGTRFCA